jgi:hypothetical protein
MKLFLWGTVIIDIERTLTHQMSTSRKREDLAKALLEELKSPSGRNGGEQKSLSDGTELDDDDMDTTMTMVCTMMGRMMTTTTMICTMMMMMRVMRVMMMTLS